MENLPLLLGAGILLLSLYLAAVFGAWFRVPGIILYILLGTLTGSWLHDSHLLHTAGEIGIVLLFFLLGLEFSYDRFKTIARKVWPAGTLDLVLNLIVTAGICMAFGLDGVSSLVIGGVVFATSSTVTAKLMQSTKRMANAESEFMLGLLIFEDLAAPLFVALLIGLVEGQALTPASLLLVMGKVAILAAGAIGIGKFVFSKLHDFFERIFSEDYYIVLTVGLALTYGGLAVYLGLSEVLGALLAGMMLSEARKTEDIENKVLPVRDLLLPLFFVYFGTTVILGDHVPYVGLLIVLVLWSTAAKVITGYFGGKWYGLSKKASMRAGLSITTRGEFSVVIASLAAGSAKLLASLFILLSVVLGIVLFQTAPWLTNRFLGKGKGKASRSKAPDGPI
ncbi:cation:proton antiporter [Cohnella silvisoli]|uniref:Cation:proton antiporter n=1 Tax=Cohnella silvisoli TaxID=2873699 RepID=A0ABV1KTT1_9BACL|nr:cation:proton antiporter [Cohnella silvisoli]MCD9022882.1 cation:proton antiporter [Cohnella silvisoli]